MESNSRGGATFKVLLPVSSEAGQGTGKRGIPDMRMDTGMLKILIMDDEESYRDSLRQVLEYMGHYVRAVADGVQAMEVYSDAHRNGETFDIVIMDLTIPGGMGGKQAVAELSKNHPEIRAIVSSGYYDDPVMADFESYGFRGALKKPFYVEDLVGEINQIVKEND